MTRQIRRVAAAMFVLFGALFLNLNYLQVIRAKALDTHPSNRRVILREYGISRGAIIAADGQELALSTPTEDSELQYQRQYPRQQLWAHATGYYSLLFGRAQLEQAFNDPLLGRRPFARNLGDLLEGRERPGDNLITTLQPAVQEAARKGLGNRKGAVAALNPQTGAVLALWSFPSYDPNALSSHDPAVMRTAWAALSTNRDQPLINRATQEIYPPGSTFKIVTAAAALRKGATPDTVFDDPAVFDVPQTTADIGNFGGGSCNGGRPITLREALAVSCNTTFARLGIQVGAEDLVAQAERFGLNREWDFQLPLAPSRIPKASELDAPALAQSAIGQRDVRLSPLQMAMIAGAIGNNGILMKPRVVDRVRDSTFQKVTTYPPTELELPGADRGQAMPADDAKALRGMMVGVVDSGTGSRAAISGVQVAGKTGTAQNGEGQPPTVWFVGFAPAQVPQVAVAVVIEDGAGVGDEATGGRLAAPIARAVMRAALATEPAQ